MVELNPQLSSRSNKREEVLANTVTAIEKRIAAIERSKLSATVLGMRAQSDIMVKQLTGLKVPCSTAEEAAEAINATIANGHPFPKRLGGSSTTVYESIAQSNVKLTAAAGFVTGMTVYVATHTHLAHRGVAVIGVDESAPLGNYARWKVLQYIASNRNVEELGPLVVDLYTKLAVASLTVMAGTNTNVRS